MESGLTNHQLSEELDQQRGSRHSSIGNAFSCPVDLLSNMSCLVMVRHLFDRDDRGVVSA